jgi:hypothetical protein
MKRETKSDLLRIACWMFVVILPTALICWLAEIYSVAAVAVALPFMLVAERVYRRLLQRYEFWEPESNSLAKNKIEPDGAANGSQPSRSE